MDELLNFFYQDTVQTKEIINFSKKKNNFNIINNLILLLTVLNVYR